MTLQEDLQSIQASTTIDDVIPEVIPTVTDTDTISSEEDQTQQIGITPEEHWANIVQGFTDAGFESYEITPIQDQTTGVIGIWDKDPHSYPNGSGGFYTANPGDYMIEFFTGEVRPIPPDVFGTLYKEATDTSGDPIPLPPGFGNRPTITPPT